MQRADLILYLVEAKQIANLELELPELIKLSTIPPELQSKTLIVFSKADLMEENSPKISSGIYCSVKKENGLQALTKAILNRLMLSDELLTKPIINNRHLAALSKCINSLHQADLSLKENLGFEFIAFELISASNALEEIFRVSLPTIY